MVSWKQARRHIIDGWSLIFVVTIISPMVVADLVIRSHAGDISRAKDLVNKGFLDSNQLVVDAGDLIRRLINNQSSDEGLSGSEARSKILAEIRVVLSHIPERLRDYDSNIDKMMLTEAERLGYGQFIYQTYNKLKDTAEDLDAHDNGILGIRDIDTLFSLRHESRLKLTSLATTQLIERLSKRINDHRKWLTAITISLGVSILVFAICVYFLNQRSRQARDRAQFAARASEALAEHSEMIAEKARKISVEHVAIWNTSPDAMILIDEAGIIETINPRGEELFGWFQTDLMGKKINMLMPEPYHSEHDEYLNRYYETGEPRIVGLPPRLVKGLRKNGEIIDIELSVAELKIEGKKRRFAGIIRDVTEREADRRSLEARKNQVEIFARSVNHDFKRHIGATGIQLMRLKRHVVKSGCDDEGFLQLWEETRQRVSTMQRSLKGIGKFLHLEQSANVTNTPLINAVRESVDLELHGTININEADFPELMLDPDMLPTAFTNIVSNALRHGYDAEVAIERRIVDIFMDGKELVFKDHGGTLDIAKWQQYMKIGVKGEASTGSGYGMELIDQILKVHGFSWYPRVEPGVWTEIRVQFDAEGTA